MKYGKNTMERFSGDWEQTCVRILTWSLDVAFMTWNWWNESPAVAKREEISLVRPAQWFPHSQLNSTVDRLEGRRIAVIIYSVPGDEPNGGVVRRWRHLPTKICIISVYADRFVWSVVVFRLKLLKLFSIGQIQKSRKIFFFYHPEESIHNFYPMWDFVHQRQKSQRRGTKYLLSELLIFVAKSIPCEWTRCWTKRCRTRWCSLPWQHKIRHLCLFVVSSLGLFNLRFDPGAPRNTPAASPDRELVGCDWRAVNAGKRGVEQRIVTKSLEMASKSQSSCLSSPPPLVSLPLKPGAELAALS